MYNMTNSLNNTAYNRHIAQNNSNENQIYIPIKFDQSFKIIVLSLYSIILLLGILGNTLTCAVVFLNKNMRRSIHFYTFNLCVADIFILLVYLPTQMRLVNDNLYWYMSKTLCSFCYFTIQLSLSASIMTLLAISVDRLRAVIDPFKWSSNSQFLSKIVIPLIWIFSVIVAFPLGYTAGIEEFEDNNTRYATCIDIWPGGGYGLPYWLTIMLIQYIIPLASIAAMNITILYKIKTSGATINTLHTRMLRMVILLLVTYTICTGMQHVVYFVTIYQADILPSYYVIANMVVLIQASVNPLIYGTNRNDFKEAIRGVLQYSWSKFSQLLSNDGSNAYSDFVNDFADVSTCHTSTKMNNDLNNDSWFAGSKLIVPGQTTEEENEDHEKRLKRQSKRLESAAFFEILEPKKISLKTVDNDSVKDVCMRCDSQEAPQKNIGNRPVIFVSDYEENNEIEDVKKNFDDTTISWENLHNHTFEAYKNIRNSFHQYISDNDAPERNTQSNNDTSFINSLSEINNIKSGDEINNIEFVDEFAEINREFDLIEDMLNSIQNQATSKKDSLKNNSLQNLNFPSSVAVRDEHDQLLKKLSNISLISNTDSGFWTYDIFDNDTDNIKYIVKKLDKSKESSL